MSYVSRSEITAWVIESLRLQITKKLNTSGAKNIPCHCPFHTDKTPSMYIDVENGRWNCFSCSRGGSIESLYKTITGRSLLKDMGVRFDEFSNFTHKLTEQPKRDLDKLDRDISINLSGGEVVSFRQSPDAIKYLRRRGLTFSVANDMGFKYVGKSTVWINRTPFTERLLVPVYENGKLISIEGRDVTGNQKPKVLYPKDTSVNTLYDLDVLDKSQPLFIVEGLMDLAVLRAWSEFKNSSSVFGASITDRQLHLLDKFSEVILIPDNDQAGDRSIERLKENLTTKFFILRVPKTYRGYELKDVGDTAKYNIPLREFIQRKWIFTKRRVH